MELTESSDVLGAETASDATLPPPTHVSLSGPAFSAVSAPFTLDLTGALPDEHVYLLAGPNPGDGPCHRLIGGYCLDITRPISVLDTGTTDGSGNLTFDRTGVPWAGAVYCHQAVIIRGASGIATALSDVVCVDHCADVDDDADGVCDRFDICAGGDDGVDTDGDGVPDGCDTCAGGDDGVDTDGDRVPDGCDICPGTDDAVDSDDDTVPDGCDTCARGDDLVDTDDDGIPDACDAAPSCQDYYDFDPTLPSGVYEIDPDGLGPGASFEVYCDMDTDGGGWTMVSRVILGVDASLTDAVGATPVLPGQASYGKLSDDIINAIRDASSYTGTTDIRMTCEFPGGVGSEPITQYCSSDCSFGSNNVVNTTPGCEQCSGSFEGGFTTLDPNEGTRGFGHHHSGGWFAYQSTHYSSTGCHSDTYNGTESGNASGDMWVK